MVRHRPYLRCIFGYCMVTMRKSSRTPQFNWNYYFFTFFFTLLRRRLRLEVWAAGLLSLVNSIIIWASNYWLTDVKNSSVHYGLQGAHSSCVVQFLQADEIGAGCNSLIMLRITGTHTAACGLCDEEPGETLTSPHAASLAWKPQCTAVCYRSQQKTSTCQFLSCEEKKLKKVALCINSYFIDTPFQIFKL